MTTTPAPALKPGQTCIVGSGKTRWEIIRIEADGTMHMSKVGGDGYTNRWAKPEDVNKVEHSTLINTLGDVLTTREQAATAAIALAEQIKRHAKPEALRKLQQAVTVTANRYIRTYRGHLAELATQEGTQP